MVILKYELNVVFTRTQIRFGVVSVNYERIVFANNPIIILFSCPLSQFMHYMLMRFFPYPRDGSVDGEFVRGRNFLAV